MSRRHFTQLTVAIITYNSAGSVDALLNSLPAAAPELSIRVVVVDNASTDDTLEQLRRHSDVVVVSAGGNTGYSGGINIARRYATEGAPLAILNPDLILMPGSLVRLVRELESSPSVGIAVPQLVDPDGTVFRHLRVEPTPAGALGEALFGAHWPGRPRRLTEILHRDADYVQDHDIDWAGAAAWVISPECNQVVGEWDANRYFLFSEETDYAYRARQEGFRLRYVASARAVHEGGGSGTSPILVALLSVNRVRHVEKTRGTAVARRFRTAVVVQHLLRVGRDSSRVSLRYLLSRRSWTLLPGGDPPDPRVRQSVTAEDERS